MSVVWCYSDPQPVGVDASELNQSVLFTRSTEVDKDVKKRGGFTKLCSLSPKLQTLVGESELARTEVCK